MRYAQVLTLSLVLSIAGAGRVVAQCAISISGMNANINNTSINYVTLQGDITLPFGSLSSAIGVWGFGCAGSGGATPPWMTEGPYDSSPGVMNFYVLYHSGHSPTDRCGETQILENQTTCEITGGLITMYQFDAQGNHCEDTMVDLLAHEMGHTLGLGDVDNNPACDGTIMGSSPSSVSAEQCEVVDDNWYTLDEYNEDHVNDGCNQTCQGTCDQGQCTEGQPSPILIDLDGNGYHLTGFEAGVHFDLNADGQAEATSWTQNGGDAFLCLDRNGNGVIDNGKELFGNFTPLSNGGTAHNGYEALAEYDLPALGGNGNGWIDEDDAIWPFLRMWSDDNQDGISQSRELSTLDAAGVVRVDTHYLKSRHRDQYGNQFNYRGHCVVRTKKGTEHEHMTYDVFFVTHAPPH